MLTSGMIVPVSTTTQFLQVHAVLNATTRARSS
jgi:hypothetical protein